VTYADTNFNSSTLAVGNITLNLSGTATGSVVVTGSGLTRTVTISSITGDGTIGISLAAATASDLAGNSAAAAGPSGTSSVDNTPPTITSATSTTLDGQYTVGASINITVNFSEAVSSTGLTITLNSGASILTGALNGVASYSGTYTVATGQTSADLSITSITGTITDAAANATVNPAIPTGQNIADARALVIDTSPLPLNLFFSGDGGGTVVIGNVSYMAGTTVSFDAGTLVSISEIADVNSIFGGWSGDCSGKGVCAVTMSSAKNVTATFSKAVFIKNIQSGNGYSLLQDAYNAASNGDTIGVRSGISASLGTLNIDRPAVRIILKGGFDDSAFTSQTGYSEIQMPLIIKNGSLVVDRMIIK
jgi:hypothetical protein